MSFDWKKIIIEVVKAILYALLGAGGASVML